MVIGPARDRPARGPWWPSCPPGSERDAAGSAVLRASGYHALLAPLVEDLLGAVARFGHGVLGGKGARGRLGKHVRDDVGVEDLALGGIGEARIAEVGRPGESLREQGELVDRLRSKGVVVALFRDPGRPRLVLLAHGLGGFG